MSSQFMTKKQVTEEFGWSPTTIWRKVKQGCFPCYPFSSKDVKFKREDLLYYAESIRRGNFSQGGAS